MRSGRQDQVVGGIDRLASTVSEAFGMAAGAREGTAARDRGAWRSANGRIKRAGV